MLSASCLLGGCQKPVEKTMLQARQPDGDSAKIVTYSDSRILNTIRADLVVSEAGGAVVFRTNLLRNRDSVEDVKMEFSSIQYIEDTVYLTASQKLYKGDTIFDLSVR